MSNHSDISNIHDEKNYDPTIWVPKPHSHGTKALWRTFIVLSIVTVLDIILYFTLPPSMGRNITFIILGILKAWFIIFEFMHMKYEKPVLKMTILLPVIFIIYLILFLLVEADFWNWIIFQGA